MPYTFLHPGFIVPFARWFPRFFSIPALIIGSFVPDLDIIYRFSETRNHIFSYSATNIIFTLIPIGTVLTYYLEYVLIPLSGKGKINVSFPVIKDALLSLPKIIFSIGIAILLHLFLDQYAHFDDTKALSLRIGENLGYELSEIDRIYKILLYLPQLTISGLGLALTGISLFMFKKELSSFLHFLLKHKFPSLFLATFICVSFTSMKVIKAGVEQGMEIDSLLIGITCGLMSSFLLTPIALWLFLKIQARRYILFPMLYIFSIYMLGLVFKEYLATYILKGIFVTAFSFIALVILHSIRIDWKIIVLLLANMILILIHPFTGYFTYLLLFNFILLLVFTLFRNHLGPQLLIIINGLIIGSIITLAYYASNKGLGAGIIVIYIMALCYRFSESTIFTVRLNKVLSLTSKLLTCVIILSVKIQLGILALGLLCFIILLQFTSKRMNQEIDDFIFFILGIPFIATIYISLQFSLLYATFSAAQLLFMLVLTQNNRIVSSEVTEKNLQQIAITD